jgi:putative transposase
MKLSFIAKHRGIWPASFFSSLKTERTARKLYRSRDQAKADGVDYIECFYDPKRRHSTIGYMSLMEFERQAGLARRCRLNPVQAQCVGSV